METAIEHKLTSPVLLRTCIKYGVIGSVAYALYFILMRLVGLVHITELRFFNYVIMCIVSFYVLKEATVLNGGRQPQFLREMGIIFLTSAMSFVAFGIFIFIFSFFDPFFIETFTNMYPGSLVFGKFSAPVFIASEGIGLSAISALGMTFFFRLYREKRRAKMAIHHPEFL